MPRRSAFLRVFHRAARRIKREETAIDVGSAGWLRGGGDTVGSVAGVLFDTMDCCCHAVVVVLRHDVRFRCQATSRRDAACHQ